VVEEIRGAWVVTKGTGGGSSVGSVSASVVRYTSEEDFSVLREKRKTNVARRSAFHHAAHCRVSFAARRVHRESRRIASRDFSRKPFAAARRAARGPRATERRGTSEGAGATSASSRLGVPRERGRDASRAGAGCGDARGGHRASSGGPFRSPAPTRDGPTRREALRRARGIPSGRRVAEHTHRARHVPPGRGREAET
jgi:hypothetical protein